MSFVAPGAFLGTPDSSKQSKRETVKKNKKKKKKEKAALGIFCRLWSYGAPPCCLRSTPKWCIPPSLFGHGACCCKSDIDVFISDLRLLLKIFWSGLLEAPPNPRHVRHAYSCDGSPWHLPLAEAASDDCF